MAFDGFVTHSIVAELRSKLMYGKIDKIYQPEKDELTVTVRTADGTFRLLISASSQSPRMHLTERPRENPITAPLFCMILRKHLTGGKIVALEQDGFDRTVRIDIECYSEMGDLVKKSLVVEIMGRHSNIILIKDDNKIIDSIKHIDFTVSAVRQILPGLIYELPPKQDKQTPEHATAEHISQILRNAPTDSPVDKLLLSAFVGMSPLMSREIVFRLCGAAKCSACDVSIDEFSENAAALIHRLATTPDGSCIVLDGSGGKPVAFSCVRLTQYSGSGALKEYPNISAAVESFYAERVMHERLNQKSSATVKIIHNNIERCEKKIAMHTDVIEKSKNRDQFKIYGDLLTANLYAIEGGAESATVINYYSENCDSVTIPLKPELSPSKNAQRYYKLYTKAKTAEEQSSKQLTEARHELEYLESVLDSITRAESYSDISEIRDELSEQGYLARSRSKKKNGKKKSEPMKFLSSDGYTILIGRNNKQNDELTIKTAYSTDIWFHTKVIPGSHTIVRTNGQTEIPDTTILEAATLAAYFSKARSSSGVPVDYTAVKNIKKPNGSKPGFVIYETNSTVFVTPDEKLVEQLRISE